MIIEIPEYNYKHNLVNSLMDLIESKYSELFYCVLVHGSFATNEVINFSDFDGLLIVKDDYVNSKELKKFKRESLAMIYNFDPLQHHGWFQLSKSQLNDYPQCYLPYEVLEYSRLMFPKVETFNLNINQVKECDYSKALNTIIRSLEIEISYNWQKKNLYDLKSYLSKIMLLPTLYYSSKNSKGIFKKNSFEAVKSDFSKTEWKVIESASTIRKDWTYSVSPLRKYSINLAYRLNKKLVKHFLAPQIAPQLRVYLNSEFRSELSTFIEAIKNR